MTSDTGAVEVRNVRIWFAWRPVRLDNNRWAWWQQLCRYEMPVLFGHPRGIYTKWIRFYRPWDEIGPDAGNAAATYGEAEGSDKLVPKTSRPEHRRSQKGQR